MSEITTQLEQATQARRAVRNLDEETVNEILSSVAQQILDQSDQILAANRADLDELDPASPFYDRAELTSDRINDLAASLNAITAIPSAYRTVISSYQHPKGFLVEKVKVPFGTVGVIYESRPNVTIDLFAMGLKSRNTIVLKGGKEVDRTNQALVSIITQVLIEHDLPDGVVSLLPPTRESTNALITADRYVDLVIPRGGHALITHVLAHATVPVIETGAGVVHIFYDTDGSLEKALPIIMNAKTRRPSVCNSLDTLLVHQDKTDDIPTITKALEDAGVTVYTGDQADLNREFLSMEMNLVTVSGLEEAIEIIGDHGTGHSEAIITENQATADQFIDQVDAACVYHNLPTSFSDGGEFGLGGEIGISTQKLHARGPMFFNDLFSYQWVAKGDGQTR